MLFWCMVFLRFIGEFFTHEETSPTLCVYMYISAMTSLKAHVFRWPDMIYFGGHSGVLNYLICIFIIRSLKSRVITLTYNNLSDRSRQIYGHAWTERHPKRVSTCIDPSYRSMSTDVKFGIFRELIHIHEYDVVGLTYYILLTSYRWSVRVIHFHKVDMNRHSPVRILALVFALCGGKTSAYTFDI